MTMQDMQPDNLDIGAGVQDAQPVDHEGAMAKADLYKLANYSFKLFKKIQENDQLEAWVQAKITKAADYIASVYHYLEYEMEFTEYGKKLDNSDVLSESQKIELKNKLSEAKAAIKELKKAQVEKQFGRVEEGILSGGEEACPHCNGTGTVVRPAREVPEAVKEKVRKYNRQAKAFHAASKRIDRNKNGIPDDEEFNEASADEPAAPNADAIAKKKAREAAQRRREEKADDDADDLSKDYTPKSEKSSSSRKVAGKAYGGEKQKDTEVDEGQGGIYGKGVYEGKSKKAKKDYDKDGKIESEKDEVIGSRRRAAGLDEATEEKRAPAKKTTRTVDLPSGAKGKITKVQGWQSQKAEKAAEKEKGLDESDDHYDDYRKKKMADRLARGISPDEASKFDRTTTTKKGTFSKKADRYDPETGKLVKQNVGRSKTNETEEKRAPAKKTTRTVDLPSGAKGKITKVQGWQSQKAEKAAEKEKDLDEAKKAKPDFLDMDKDGNKKEPMKKAIKDKKNLKKIAESMWQQAKKRVAENFDQTVQQTEQPDDTDLGEANMSDADYQSKLEWLRQNKPQELQAALQSSDPNALNKLVGFAMPAGQKPVAAVSPNDQGTLGQDAQQRRYKSAVYPSRNAGLNENADLDRIKEVLNRLNG